MRGWWEARRRSHRLARLVSAGPFTPVTSLDAAVRARDPDRAAMLPGLYRTIDALDGSPGGVANAAAFVIVCAGVLHDLRLSREAIDHYDEAVRRHRDATDPTLCEHVNVALVSSAAVLVELDEQEQALARYDAVVDRCRAGLGDASRVHARALLNAGALRQEFGELRTAFDHYDEAVHRFRDDPDPEVRPAFAAALYDRAGMLALGLRDDEAIADLDELARRFGADPAEVDLMAKGQVLREWVRDRRARRR